MSKTDNAFVWPEFKRDRDRIRAYSNRYRDVSIAEAFIKEARAKNYDVRISNRFMTDEHINEVPKELRVGEVISARILDINKDGVIFDTSGFKTTLMSSVNLYKYDKFHHFLPRDPIPLVVTKIVKDRVTVDPLGVMRDTFITSCVSEPWKQKALTLDPLVKNPRECRPIKVKNLQLTRGGFIGQAVIPNVSDFVGDEYSVPAFIPGSQIVLNITNDFDSFVGKTVNTFIVNYVHRPGSDKMSLVCSAKEYLRYLGEKTLIKMFNDWTEDNDAWKAQVEKTYEGVVTGVINSSKRCGVFVELPDLNITGMIKTTPEDLVTHRPQDSVFVKITDFEEDIRYNHDMQQAQHVAPYIIEDGAIKNCNIKPVLQFA